MRETIFKNSKFTVNYDIDANNCNENTIKLNSTCIHTEITANCCNNYPDNKVINQAAPIVDDKEKSITRENRPIPAQLSY